MSRNVECPALNVEVLVGEICWGRGGVHAEQERGVGFEGGTWWRGPKSWSFWLRLFGCGDFFLWGEAHVLLSEAVLADVDDEDLALGEDVSPGFGGHVGDDDEGLVAWEGFDFCEEVVGLGVVGAGGASEEGEGFAPGLRLKGGLGFPGEEVGPEGGGDADVAEVAEGAADEGEGALEEVGSDEGVVGAEAVEDNGGLAGAEAGGIVFADAGAAATGDRANGGGPMDLFGTVARLIGAEATGFAGRVAGLMAFAIPGVIEFSGGEEFLGDKGLWEDEDFLGDGGLFLETEEIEREG